MTEIGSRYLDEPEVQLREIRNMNLGAFRIKVVFRATGLDEVTEGGDREKPAKGT